MSATSAPVEDREDRATRLRLLVGLRADRLRPPLPTGIAIASARDRSPLWVVETLVHAAWSERVWRVWDVKDQRSRLVVELPAAHLPWYPRLAHARLALGRAPDGRLLIALPEQAAEPEHPAAAPALVRQALRRARSPALLWLDLPVGLGTALASPFAWPWLFLMLSARLAARSDAAGRALSWWLWPHALALLVAALWALDGIRGEIDGLCITPAQMIEERWSGAAFSRGHDPVGELLEIIGLGTERLLAVPDPGLVSGAGDREVRILDQLRQMRACSWVRDHYVQSTVVPLGGVLMGPVSLWPARGWIAPSLLVELIALAALLPLVVAAALVLRMADWDLRR